MQQDKLGKLGDEYVLLKLLGSGGYADVYKARHTELGYIRAIRILRQLVLSEDDAVYKKFLRECKVLLRLGNGCHPNIVHIYQPRLVDRHPLVEMDYVDGMDLKDYIEKQNGEVPVDEVIRMAKEIGSALAYCHRDIYKVCYDRDEDDLMDDPDDGEKVLIDDAAERRLIEKYRVIHNDIQTRNIMRRNSDGMYVLLDFGLAIDGNGDVVSSSRRSKGAPEFKPPEKWDDDEPTTQGDIYSFGCVLYAMLVGKPPFPLEVKNGHVSMSSLYELGIKHKSARPAPIQRSDAPDWLLRVVKRCLEKDPVKRYKDAYEMYEDILEGATKVSGGGEDSGAEKGSVSEKATKSKVGKTDIVAAKVIPAPPNGNTTKGVTPPQKTMTKGSIERDIPVGYVDLGLPSGTLWKETNEAGGFYSYDEAKSKFGSRLPTKAQLEELEDKCEWDWIGDGYRVTGPNGNSIVLPASGYRSHLGIVGGVGSYGDYWSTTPDGSDFAWFLGFDSGEVDMYDDNRSYGYSVRLVR